jgi:glycosyltransferase involved in cell wall biosynthesis
MIANTNTPINVLYIIWSLDLGGAERVVINLAKGLDKDRFNPMVCCLNEQGKFADELEKEGIRVIALNKKSKLDFTVINKLARIMKENNINVVNTHLWGANFWGRIAAKLAKVPVIIATEHNEDTWKLPFYFLFDNILSDWTDKIIAVSSSVKEFYVSKGIPTDKIEVVYNGIDIKQGQSPSGTVPVLHSAKIREEFGIKEEETVLAVIGRLVPQKGHCYFLSALKELLKDHKIMALIVGSGPIEEELKQFSYNLGLNGNVIFTGLRRDIPDLLNNCIDILVMPSLREGLPLIALEAMSSGVPIIASKVGGIPELVIDGKTGLLVEPENHVALKEAIERLINDKGLRQQLIDNAKRKVEEEFCLDSMLSKTQNLYQELYSLKRNK